ncbi:MAG: 3-deoxy-8-phosphooctulonate synthase [bacterium]|nr:3-deoxy-8-phosphooctulonate synthase [bacterium]
MDKRVIEIGGQPFGDGRLGVIGGPCVIEDERLALEVGFAAKEITEKLGIPYVYKSSYLKDNRTSHTTYQGPGVVEGLEILARVREEVGVPVLTDIHTLQEVEPAAEVCDALQLPAYLSKQTQLALALGRTGKPINVKKAQFFTPEQTKVPISKIESTGNSRIILTERGSVYGYGDIVFDPRNLVYLKEFGYPVMFDVTHVVRLPGKTSVDLGGGLRGFIPPLARAAAAIGCDGLFLEFHPRPNDALCDASSMLELDNVEWLLRQVKEIHEMVSAIGEK